MKRWYIKAITPLSGLNSFKFTAKYLLTDNNSSINTDDMNFLSIDFSTGNGSLFVKAKSKTFRKVLQSDKFINDLIAERILDFLGKNKLKLEDIDQIFVNQGPGSFSGIRTSIAIAKGLSITNKLNLYGFNSYDLKDMNYMNIVFLYEKGSLTKNLIKPFYLR